MNGQWLCRVCAAKAVEGERTHTGDPANKKRDPGHCEKCQFPGILFWVEPIQHEAAAPQEITPACDGCQFYLVAFDSNNPPKPRDWGRCRLNPPQWAGDEYGGFDFPSVDGDAWCSHFTPPNPSSIFRKE